MAIKMYRGGWLEDYEIDVSDNAGTHYMQQIHWGFVPRSCVIPEYKAIRFHMEPDGSGSKTDWLHVGNIYDLTWYRGFDQSRMQNGFGIEVKDIGYDQYAFLTVYGGTSQVDKGDYSDFSWYLRFHVKGDDADDEYYEGDDDFPNDKIQSLAIPRFHNLVIYDNKNGGGKEIKVDNTGFVDLSIFGFKNHISSFHLISEDLEMVDITYDWDAQEKTSEAKYMAHEEVSNDTSLPVTPDVSLSNTIERTNEYEFNQEEGTSVTVGAEAEVGFLGTGGEMETEVEENVEVGFGESNSETRQYEISASADIEMPGWTSATAVLTMQLEKVKVPVKRTWKSKQTGETTYDEGTQTYDNAADIRITYQDMAYIPNDEQTEDQWKRVVQSLQYN